MKSEYALKKEARRMRIHIEALEKELEEAKAELEDVDAALASYAEARENGEYYV